MIDKRTEARLWDKRRLETTLLSLILCAIFRLESKENNYLLKQPYFSMEECGFEAWRANIFIVIVHFDSLLWDFKIRKFPSGYE